MSALGSKNSKGYSFIVMYLMGLDRDLLEGERNEEYVYSEALTILDRIDNASLVRNACNVRQKLLKYYSKYERAVSFEEELMRNVSTNVAFLKEQGFDLMNEYRKEYSILGVINYLTTVINRYLPDVLESVKMPYAHLVLNLFYLYPLDKKNMSAYSKTMTAGVTKFPYGLYITRYNRVKEYLPSLFRTDFNLFIGVHNLGEETYKITEVEAFEFSWDSLGVDKSTYFDAVKSSTFYVDCDNLRYFTFLAILEKLKETKSESSKYIFNLYTDDESHPIWGDTTFLEDSAFTFNVIQTARIKGSKSLADIVMTTQIALDSTKDGISQVVVSSDSDYYGIIKAGVKVDAIYYESQSINPDYLRKLKQDKIKSVNMLDFSNDKLKERHVGSIIEKLVVSYIKENTLGSWTVDKIKNYILSKQVDLLKYEIHLIEHDVEYRVSKIISSLNVTFINGAPKVVFNNIEMTKPVAV